MSMTSRLIFLLIATGAVMAPTSAFSKDLVVYSARKEHLIKPLFDAYTQKTGTKITYITDKAGPLLQRMKAEGRRTRADVLITVDAGNLWHAANEGMLAEVESETLKANVPAHMRDDKGRWFGLSVRARTVVYNPEKVNVTELSTYEDLADLKWKGRLCLRTSKKVYNQSLVAMSIDRLGEEKAEAMVKGWVSNLGAAPFSNDTKTMKAIVAGKCDVAIVNTYYFGRLMKKDAGLPLKIFWPNQETSGVHVNISGAGVAKYAKHPVEAVKLIEWLSSEQAQGIFAGLNMETPVNSNVPVDPVVAAWGEFKADATPLGAAGRLQTSAVKLMDRVGYK